MASVVNQKGEQTMDPKEARAESFTEIAPNDHWVALTPVIGGQNNQGRPILMEHVWLLNQTTGELKAVRVPEPPSIQRAAANSIPKRIK